MPARKRARSDYSGGQSAATRAMFANMYTSKKYPYSGYGRQYIPRGTYLKQAGRTYQAATPAQRAWRRSNNYHGVGMYTGQGMFNPFTTRLGRKFRHGLTGLVSKTAGELGAMSGIPGAASATAALSRRAMKASGIGMYTGQGAYDTVKNELIAGGHSTEGVMRFDAQNDEDAICISHSEYVMDVYAPPEGEVKTDIKLPLNAGEAATFPMLAQLAANFEDFEIVQLAFTYKPTLSDWQTTSGQVGQIIMATNYNPSADKWTSKQQILAQTGSTSARTIDSTFHGVECDANKTHNDGHYLVRTGPPRPEQDLKDFDHGWTQLSIVDTPKEAANKTLGELHVSYTIKLSKPRIWSSVANDAPSFQVFLNPLIDTRLVRQPSNGSAEEMNMDVGFCGASGNHRTIVMGDDQVDGLLYGRQNSLPVRIVSAVPIGDDKDYKAMKAVFPAQFAGDVKVRIVIAMTGVTGSANAQRPVIAVRSEGQVSGIKDQLTSCAVRTSVHQSSGMDTKPSDSFEDTEVGTQNTLVYFSPPQQICAGAASKDREWVMQAELHLRVAVARDAVDNALVFKIAGSVDATASVIDCKQFFMEITPYNTRLNYRQDGSNDKVILVDKAKQIVTY